MTLTSKIIRTAYRESNLKGIGETLTAPETEEGLDALNRIVLAAYGYEVGRQLVDWPVGQQGIGAEDVTTWSQNEWAYPPANMRLIAASNTPQTVYLHPQPSDGARMAIIDPANRLAAAPITVDGNGRQIQGAADVVVNTNGAARIWFYRADEGDWVLLSTLTGVDPEEFPFPPEFDDYFITTLAMRLNPRYGRSMSEETSAALARTLEKLRARYQQYTGIFGEPALSNLTLGFGSRFSRSLNGDVGGRRNPRRMIRPPHYEG
jgi:hypothetical protein